MNYTAKYYDRMSARYARRRMIRKIQRFCGPILNSIGTIFTALFVTLGMAWMIFISLLILIGVYG